MKTDERYSDSYQQIINSISTLSKGFKQNKDEDFIISEVTQYTKRKFIAFKPTNNDHYTKMRNEYTDANNDLDFQINNKNIEKDEEMEHTYSR